MQDDATVNAEAGAQRAPDVALARFLQEQARKATQMSRALTTMAETVPDMLTLPSPTRTGALDGEVVLANEARQRVTAWLSAAGHEVMGCHPGDWAPFGDPEHLSALQAGVTRGVRWRSLYPTRVIGEADELLHRRAGLGEEIRLLPHMPYRMLIVDSQVLVRTSDPTTSRQRILSREPALRESLAAWFEEMWTRAIALADYDVLTSAHDTVRRDLLECLARGDRDEQIAETLGMSVRTIRRRVAELMLELGAESRFQAGIRAAQRGWI